MAVTPSKATHRPALSGKGLKSRGGLSINPPLKFFRPASTCIPHRDTNRQPATLLTLLMGIVKVPGADNTGF